MVNILENIDFLGQNFTFVQRKNDKLIYKSINKNLEQMKILEITISESENRIKKIDIHTIEIDETIESLHIIRGVDGITELNYYPLKEEAVSNDNKTELYNISIYKTYSETSDKLYPELYEIELVKKGHKKHKFLTKKAMSNILFETKNNKTHKITSPSISKMNELTKKLIPDILKIEKDIFQLNKKEKTDICLDDEEIEEIIENYPNSLYIYDRNYNLAGMKNNALVYRNTEDDIIEIEIYFNKNKDRIKEVRFIEYQFVEIEGIKHKAKCKIIRLVIDGNEIKASLCTRKKENIYLNHHVLEGVLMKSNAIVPENNKIVDVTLDMSSSLGNYHLIKSDMMGVDFVDKNNLEYLVTAKSYILFKTLISYSKNMIRNLENKLIYSNYEEETKEKNFVKN